ncbi:putative cytokinetic ring protein SteA [Texcoconibacillus texcoconensis]|uniref:Putative membrane-anchored protein n=1 Tax=Texcoconibacillus texcoconensis TaxID=1095777 RepID=A0A840QNV3_9BACI|nr:putative cytokinetic ring protein SteA [Texcoconibacillus texcoconensis]MBB5173054.1 putative membrane-anchored protein [Texcoconibacillus texcoconensis]
MTPIKGYGFYDQKTKRLIQTIPTGQIALIAHRDIDRLAAQELVGKNVRAVVNSKSSFSGEFPHRGLEVLFNHGIPVFDIVEEYGPKGLESVHSEYLLIENNALSVWRDGSWEEVSTLKAYDEMNYLKALSYAEQRKTDVFSCFADNTLTFAQQEVAPFRKSVHDLPQFEQLQYKKVLVVARHANYLKDLRAVFSTPAHRRVQSLQIVAVDGAADGLRQFGIIPDMIVGDMDSISDPALFPRTKFVAHSYKDGRSPGAEHLKRFGLQALAVPFLGVSEDLAIMLSAVSGAEVIYTLGCRNNMIDMLEKGRSGMASTVLTRMFAGDRVVDLSGYHLWKKHEMTTGVSERFSSHSPIRALSDEH